MLSAYKMTSKVDKIVHRCVDSQKSLRLCCLPFIFTKTSSM